MSGVALLGVGVKENDGVGCGAVASYIVRKGCPPVVFGVWSPGRVGRVDTCDVADAVGIVDRCVYLVGVSMVEVGVACFGEPCEKGHTSIATGGWAAGVAVRSEVEVSSSASGLLDADDVDVLVVEPAVEDDELEGAVVGVLTVGRRYSKCAGVVRGNRTCGRACLVGRLGGRRWCSVLSRNGGRSRWGGVG